MANASITRDGYLARLREKRERITAPPLNVEGLVTRMVGLTLEAVP